MVVPSNIKMLDIHPPLDLASSLDTNRFAATSIGQAHNTPRPTVNDRTDSNVGIATKLNRHKRRIFL